VSFVDFNFNDNLALSIDSLYIICHIYLFLGNDWAVPLKSVFKGHTLLAYAVTQIYG